MIYSLVISFSNHLITITTIKKKLSKLSFIKYFICSGKCAALPMLFALMQIAIVLKDEGIKERSD